MQQSEQTEQQKAAASAAFLSSQIAAIFERELDYIDLHTYEDAERETWRKLALEEGMGR